MSGSAAIANVTIREKIDITKGLTHNGVTSLLKDSRGYLWIGTYDGLNKYNYNYITHYKNQVRPQLFQSNRIHSLAEDEQGRLWIGNEGGVTLFDYEKYSFQQLSSANEGALPIIQYIHLTSSRAICVGSERLILIYDMQGDLLRSDVLPSDLKVNGVVYADRGYYILASNFGLLLYSSKDGKIEHLSDTRSNEVNAIVKCGDSEYIIGYSSGIQYVKIELKQGKVDLKTTTPIIYDNCDINTIAVDENGRLWLGTENRGVLYRDNYADISESELKCLLSDERVKGFAFDEESVWVSTSDGGVIELSRVSSPFNIWESDVVELPRVLPYSEDLVLISSQKKLSVYNRKTRSEESLPFTVPSSVQGLYKTILRDLDNRFWIISSGAKMPVLYRIDGDRTVEIKSDKLSAIKKGRRNSLFPIEAICDSDGNFWVSYINDVYRICFDANGNISAVESIEENPVIKELDNISRTRVFYYDDLKNLMWIGTNHCGLFRIDLNAEKGTLMCDLQIDNYRHSEEDLQSLSSDFVSTILRTKEGTLWVGTEQGGLCKVSETDRDLRFETISESNGLSNNVVKSIQEDVYGNLWIGTNIGLSLYNLESKKFSIYGHNMGRLNSEDFWYSSFVFDDGEMVFSQPKKLLLFNPETLYNKSATVNIRFAGLKISNERIHPNKTYNGEVILEKELTDGDTLQLKWYQNIFSIDIDDLSDNYLSNHEIYYQLSSINDEWINLPANSHTITFNNVESGSYLLRVGGIDARGEIANVIELNIIISPPFTQSFFAYILYLIVIGLIAFVVVRSILLYQTLKHELKIKELDKRANEDKLRYLSNISHELKTPLSLILAPVALLREKFSLDISVTSKLDLIKRQSKKLLELIDLTHGIEANDLKGLKVSRTIFSFEAMINDLKADFEFITQYDNKTFFIENRSNVDIYVEADRAMLEKIVSNLLSNAIKHTVKGDEIKLSYWISSEDQKRIIFSLSDTGYGIDAQDLPFIFDRFYQAKRSGANNIGGTGIGLTFSKMLVELHNGEIIVESELNVGTTFTVTLPIIVEAEVSDNTCDCSLEEGVIYASDISEIIVESEYSSSLIYLIEDNHDLRELICEIIGRYFNVRGFANATELFDKLENEWPDLIISDVMMPNDMDGYELCSRIKSDIKTSHIPVILLTACATVDEKIRGLQVGADAYIPKPFYPKHLITRIETLLHNRQLLRERFQIGIPLVYGKEVSNSALDNEFMQRLYKLFDENLSNEDVNMSNLARELGKNRSLFFKKVKSITNSSPAELLKDYRLKRGAELLQKGELSVNEICYSIGFKDRSHFSRAFKEKYGLPPSKFVGKGNAKTTI